MNSFTWFKWKLRVIWVSLFGRKRREPFVTHFVLDVEE